MLNNQLKNKSMDERSYEPGERHLHKDIEDFLYLRNCIIKVRERTNLTGMALLDPVITELARSKRYSAQHLSLLRKELLEMISHIRIKKTL